MLAAVSTVSAAKIDIANLDDNISYSNPVLTQDENEFHCELFSNTYSIEAASDKQSFTLTAPKYSFYKLHIRTKTPDMFAAGGKQLCTVFETKFRATLQDESVSDYIPNMTYGFYVTAEDSSTFVGEGEAQKRVMPVDGTEYTMRYVMNPVKQTVEEYRNDELITTTAFSALGTKNITQMRFYPRPLPGKNREGLYVNGNPSINYGTDDGAVVLATPIIWEFDYIKIYQITPYEIESSDPADSGSGAGMAGPYTVTFDSEMDASTFTPSNVEMTNEISGEKIMLSPSLSGDLKTCMLYPMGSAEYFTAYRLSFLPDIKDSNGFYHSEPVGITFTTEKRTIREAVVYSDNSAPVSLKCGGADMETLINGTVTGEMGLKNTSASAQSVRIIAALYTKAGNDYSLSAKAETAVSVPAGETSVTLPQLTVTDSENQFIKYMVWDSTGYPLTDAVICDSTHTGI